MWAVEVSYRGGLSSILDKKVEEVALESGGTWTGQGYSTGPGRRSIVWQFSTKREATNYVQKVKTIGNFSVKKPWKRKD